MIYSYIKPRKKSAITQDIQLMFTFFSITIAMLVLTYFFLLFKDYSFREDLKSIAVSQASLEVSLQAMKKEISYIEKQKEFSERIYTKNSVLKDSISNLFDLVPQRITLSEAVLQENGLTLYGITPNKDIYNFMLQAPLRSIFHRTYSSFYPMDNGWYSFVSTNYIDEEDTLNEN